MLKDFEPPLRSDTSIESLNESQELMFDSETSDSLWEGERFDVGMAVEALLNAEQGRIGEDGMRATLISGIFQSCSERHPKHRGN